ncbi:MAG TPA: hypothetical protein DCG49_03320 [Ruminococcus sp.]|nr:hypothetical protein [Ruminococcus sp.]
MKHRMIAILAAFLLPAALLSGCGQSDSLAETESFGEVADDAGDAEDSAEDMYAEEAEPTMAKSGADEDGGYEDDAVSAEEPEAFSAEDLPADPDESAVIDDSNADSSLPPDEDPAQPFVLTAGEWNDNENWGFFTNLVHTGLISFPSFGLQPCCRIAVHVTNHDAPVKGQVVKLVQEGEAAPLWIARTDRFGTAYLFYPETTAPGTELHLQSEGAEDVTVSVPQQNDAGQGNNSVPLLEYTMETDQSSQQFDQTEVMFILDTTGSMGDEITYLQRDFASIAGEVADGHTTFSVNFYKDQGDIYVTKCNDFSDDLTEIQHMLNQEYADGGDDEPEAVAEILSETLVEAQWGENTNKIAFLIFDAPPHAGTQDIEKIRNAVSTAATRGIHLVPVVASNASRETELFGRAAAIMTNSNYIFLTDDSGVGDSHLEPIIGSYEVELLHDIIVRNIREVADKEE